MFIFQAYIPLHSLHDTVQSSAFYLWFLPMIIYDFEGRRLKHLSNACHFTLVALDSNRGRWENLPLLANLIRKKVGERGPVGRTSDQNHLFYILHLHSFRLFYTWPHIEWCLNCSRCIVKPFKWKKLSECTEHTILLLCKYTF